MVNSDRILTTTSTRISNETLILKKKKKCCGLPILWKVSTYYMLMFSYSFLFIMMLLRHITPSCILLYWSWFLNSTISCHVTSNLLFSLYIKTMKDHMIYIRWWFKSYMGSTNLSSPLVNFHSQMCCVSHRWKEFYFYPKIW